MKNKLYRFNRWLDNNEISKFFLLLFSVVFFTIPLQFGNFIGICVSLSTITLVCLFVIFRMNIMNDKVNFNRSEYVVPEIGEIVVVKKDFYYDGLFRKYINQSDLGQKPIWKISKGTELVILSVEETNGDWKIRFLDQSKNKILGIGGTSISRISIYLYYLDTKSYWDTKENIRNDVLNRLGI
jgi:hypothetical protein